MVMATGRALLDPYQALRRAGLKTDMWYADLGAGTLGHFVFPAAQIVGPEGRVYGVDILKGTIESMQSKAQLLSLPNVIPLWGDMERADGIRIESERMDLVSLVGVAELVKGSPQVLRHASRLLKLHGRLLIIDWGPGMGSIVVKDEDRIASEGVIQEVLKHPFRLVEEFKAGPQHWGLIFERTA
ncbi:hypothetical protein CO174_04630 [Candidatus Uhrbacteria bacterium CG_4_9_14_3_um_filter_50_9]|uniref:Methyltransferase domain-containing protein n=1 Tax=Candidatus Uhrbacteria bacterium CG_4_9_14_3_um_filter_50_9 TaxID=1975035 RepID=A0A2M7XB60_9BACT|nr:MAG: hypothetical protein CO174_04630 [Candidatus Uhrbacteria bacterium CG_4_9_14_3_um_filter_50_9]